MNLVVHRLKLVPQGASFVGERPADETQTEFLASTDNWFRPVQIRTGPEGCLWVVDMHRLVIEHPIWIPPADLARLDLRAGSTMGRIFRVKPINKQVSAFPIIHDKKPQELVPYMNTSNGTLRDLVMMQML
ncbi:MAG TPA: hypothetical protein PKD72_07305, partial [Gemmatales bacterium]|nr:hypothetical protein [Gemmatales bacterium]